MWAGGAAGLSNVRVEERRQGDALAFPSLAPCSSQRLVMNALERRARRSAMIDARMTEALDLCWKLEGSFSYILNICINT